MTVVGGVADLAGSQRVRVATGLTVVDACSVSIKRSDSPALVRRESQSADHSVVVATNEQGATQALVDFGSPLPAGVVLISIYRPASAQDPTLVPASGPAESVSWIAVGS